MSLVNTNPFPPLFLFLFPLVLSLPLPPSVVAKMNDRCKEKREGGVCVCMSEQEAERYYIAYQLDGASLKYFFHLLLPVLRGGPDPVLNYFPMCCYPLWLKGKSADSAHFF